MNKSFTSSEITLLCLGAVLCFAYFFYYLFNYSYPIKVSLEVLNENKKVTQILGSPIEKNSYFGEFYTVYQDGETQISTYYGVKGSRPFQFSNIELEMTIKNGKKNIHKLIIYTDKGNFHIVNDDDIISQLLRE